MNASRALGLLAAFSLGVALGGALAPTPTRRVLRRRIQRGVPRLRRISRQIADRSRAAAQNSAAFVTELASSLAQSIRRRAALARAPLARLKRSFASDPVLSRRSIWVDALGDTILLHGVVEDDDEWRSADTLARMVSPDGSVRNLLQVRRRADA